MKTSIKTKTPVSTTTHEVEVPMQDAFYKTEHTFKGEVVIHKYSDGSALLFAKIKTAYGFATLKKSFNPKFGWKTENSDQPCTYLPISWESVQLVSDKAAQLFTRGAVATACRCAPIARRLSAHADQISFLPRVCFRC